MSELSNKLIEQSALSGINFNQIFVNIIFSFAILIVGFLVGKTVVVLLKKLSKKLEIEKNIRPSFIDLFIVVVKWAIYLMFIGFALKKLGIGLLTNLFNSVLIAIPSFVGALILVGVGFAIAIYLREIIEESEITGWKMFSQMVFYFVIYIFGIYSIKTALLILDNSTTNWIMIIFTFAFAVTGILVKIDSEKSFNSIRK